MSAIPKNKELPPDNGYKTGSATWQTDAKNSKLDVAAEKLIKTFKKDKEAILSSYKGKESLSKLLGKRSNAVKELSALSAAEISKILVECGKIDMDSAAELYTAVWRMTLIQDKGIKIESELHELSSSSNPTTARTADELIDKQAHIYTKEVQSEELWELTLIENTPDKIASKVLSEILERKDSGDRMTTYIEWADKLNRLEEYDKGKSDAVMISLNKQFNELPKDIRESTYKPIPESLKNMRIVDKRHNEKTHSDTF